MDTELEKLVEAGKLTPRAAQKLEKLKPGTFCLHKSWGFGRVSDWNLLLNQIVIDFTGKKSHPMQAQYAAENVTPLAPDHFLARKATDLPSIKIWRGRTRLNSFEIFLKVWTVKPLRNRSVNGWLAMFSPRRNGSAGG